MRADVFENYEVNTKEFKNYNPSKKSLHEYTKDFGINDNNSDENSSKHTGSSGGGLNDSKYNGSMVGSLAGSIAESGRSLTADHGNKDQRQSFH